MKQSRTGTTFTGNGGHVRAPRVRLTVVVDTAHIHALRRARRGNDITAHARGRDDIKRASEVDARSRPRPRRALHRRTVHVTRNGRAVRSPKSVIDVTIVTNVTTIRVSALLQARLVIQCVQSDCTLLDKPSGQQFVSTQLPQGNQVLPVTPNRGQLPASAVIPQPQFTPQQVQQQQLQHQQLQQQQLQGQQPGQTAATGGFASPPNQFDLASKVFGDANQSGQQLTQQEGEGKPFPKTVTPLSSKTVNVMTDELQMEQGFRDVLQFIADRADVNLSTPISHVGDTKVHLLSEQFTPKSDFVSLTTTEALQQLIRAWWAEFKRRDITPTSQRGNKLFCLFKNSANKPSLRPYIAADTSLVIEPLNRPAVNIPWLPQSGKKVELTDLDLQHFEKQVRGTLRVTNFSESLLQAWRYGDTPHVMLDKIMSAFIHATKTQMQIQTSLFSQIVQLRRDLALHGATVSMDVQQQLRHAPILDQTELFPADLLTELNERVKRSYETSIIVQTFRKTQNQRNYDGKNSRQWPTNDQQKAWQRSDRSPPLSESDTPSPESSNGMNVDVQFAPDSKWTDLLKDLQKCVDKQKEVPVGGRLKQFWKGWRELGAPKRVYNWFRRGYKLPFTKIGRLTADKMLKTTCPDYLKSKYPVGSEKQKALDQLVSQLLAKGAIEEVTQGEQVVFNRVFLRPKPPKPRQVATEFRLIIDLSEVNKFLKVKTFQMDTPAEIRKNMEQNLWGTSLDLSDAYHHIPIRADFHKYLAFQVGTKQYWYTVCPFGLSPIPQVFTDAMAPLKQYARTNLKMVTFQYLDDWLLLFENPEIAAAKTMTFARKCLDLGLLVNLDKSEVLPTQNILHLGVLWDLKNAWVQPADKQIKNITTGARTMLDAGKATVKMLESLQGKLVAAEKFTQYGKINYRLFQRFVTKVVHELHAAQWVRLPWEVREDLEWWATPRNLQLGVPCILPKATVQVTTDASDRGWGAFYEQKALSGLWTDKEVHWHINKKELMVVLIVLQKWGKFLKNETVQFWMDNRTAVSYVCKQGGTKSASLMLLARELFLLASSLNIWVTAAYIPGTLNVVADMHSRAGLVLKTEWMVSHETFSWICQASLVGRPEIDLFANSYTTQLPRFGTPCPEFGAEVVDALNSAWPDSVLYAYPPTCIMDRVVEKIQTEQPRALVLIASQFVKAPWFSFLTKWEHTVRQFPSGLPQLHQPHFKHSHPNPSMLCLAVYNISFQK